MSKNVAVIGVAGEVVAINVHDDGYELQPNEVIVTTVAWVGGDYIEGYFYAPQPYPTWTRKDGEWIPPKPRPESLGFWHWNEETQEWEE